MYSPHKSLIQQGKIIAAKSLGDIAVDLTEHGGGTKITRLGDNLKHNLIMASTGSLASTGRSAFW